MTEGEREREGRAERVLVLWWSLSLSLFLSVCFKGHSMLMAIYLRKESVLGSSSSDIKNLFVSAATLTD